MKQAKTLTEAELKRLFAVVRNGKHALRNEVALSLSFWAGLRVCEISSLKVKDIYDCGGRPKDIVRLLPSQTKGASHRTIFINDKLQKLLFKYYEQQNLPDRELPLIPSQKRRSHFSPNSLCQLFKRLLVSAGFNEGSSHSGRRTFITNLANKSVNAKVIMTLAGHKNLATTQRYIDVREEQLTLAVNLV